MADTLRTHEIMERTNMLSRIACDAAAFAMITQSNVRPALAQGADGQIGILLAAGDIAECKPKTVTRSSGFRQEETAKLLGEEIAAAKKAGIPVRVLALGDLAYDKGSEDQFKCFHNSWGEHKKEMLPVPGNHEYGSPNAKPYFDYFTDNTLVSESGPKKGTKKGDYSLNFPDKTDFPDKDFRPWHLIALNSARKGPEPEQVKWLTSDLKSNDQRCVLAFAHFFAFSSGRHGHEPPDFDPKKPKANLNKAPVPYKKMVDAFRTLHAHGASLLLSGHDHQFEQFKRQDADRNVVADGLRSFIVGTGGTTFYSEIYTRHWANSERFHAKWHGVLKLELFETQYRWQFVPTETAKKTIPAELTAPSNKEDCNMRKKPS
jgi:hypothetical protein